MQVGNTNRWRIPTELGSDLLGTSQAMRALESSRKGRNKIITTGTTLPERGIRYRVSSAFSLSPGGEAVDIVILPSIIAICPPSNAGG